MKSHGNLFEPMLRTEKLAAAMHRAALGKRARPEVQRFLAEADRELAALREDLRSGAYCPGPYRQFRILDPKPRLISCAPFRDRVVHQAVCAAIAPCIERRLTSDTYACRRGYGSHRAIRRAQSHCRRYAWYLKTDIARYYDSIDHAMLLDLVQRLFREQRLQELLARLVAAPYPGQRPGSGLPIGNLTSQWLANLYLDGLDHWLKETRRVPAYLRYMDDLVIWQARQDVLWEEFAALRTWLHVERRLELKPQATVIAPVEAGLPWLGFRVFPGLLRRRGSRVRHQRRLLRRREAEYRAGKLTARQLTETVRSLLGPYQWLGMTPPLRSDLEM